VCLVIGTRCIAANLPILFLGRPGVGKTTAIREIARTLSDELRKRVVIVDTSNEIGGDGDVPHHAIGGARRMQVADASKQHHVMVGLMGVAFTLPLYWLLCCVECQRIRPNLCSYAPCCILMFCSLCCAAAVLADSQLLPYSVVTIF
jgi:GTPase SAR1 family protein